MLVISRKVDESFFLKIPGRDDLIKITVVKNERTKTRLGVDAESDVIVIREELMEPDVIRRAAKKS